MRWTVSMLVLLLTGCGTVQEFSMLDTAPQNDSQLRHPEWAEVQVEEAPALRNASTFGNEVVGPYGERKSDEIDSLATFLARQGIPYEVVSGGHIMIKLRQSVSFHSGSAAISSGSRQWLDRLGVYLSGLPEVDIVIEGHTDSTGTNEANEALSQRRAHQVKSQLVKHSVLSSNIYTRSYGEYMPECSNSTEEGQMCNRRVELTLIIDGN